MYNGNKFFRVPGDLRYSAPQPPLASSERVSHRAEKMNFAGIPKHKPPQGR